ncbi:MAG: hypothetical protein K5978_04545 [Campylobacter sp.]|nr:hypothetical protein [Campylobacter sp.]
MRTKYITQARGLEYMMEAEKFCHDMEQKGFKAKTNFNGDFVFTRIHKAPMLKGFKGDYSTRFYALVGNDIVERKTLKIVDESINA